jgi:hypothetical protein
LNRQPSILQAADFFDELLDGMPAVFASLFQSDTDFAGTEILDPNRLAHG